jgi:hypothetical protein
MLTERQGAFDRPPDFALGDKGHARSFGRGCVDAMDDPTEPEVGADAGRGSLADGAVVPCRAGSEGGVEPPEVVDRAVFGEGCREERDTAMVGIGSAQQPSFERES